MDEVAGDVGNIPIVVRPRTPGGRCWYEIEIAAWFLEYYKCDWFDPRDFYFNEPIDKNSVMLNAEVTQAYGGLTLTYATVQDHMRPALREHRKDASGLRALTIMRHFLDAPGREVVEGLLEQFPNHVIEFTCMSKSYGTLGWQSVVWEVRNY